MQIVHLSLQSPGAGRSVRTVQVNHPLISLRLQLFCPGTLPALRSGISLTTLTHTHIHRDPEECSSAAPSLFITAKMESDGMDAFQL